MIHLHPAPKTRGMAPAEAAAYWLIRHDHGDLSPGEKSDFDDWHADPNHARAYAKASEALALFDSDHGQDRHLKALRQTALGAGPLLHWRWPAAAAGLAALLLMGVVTFTELDRSQPDPVSIVAAESPAAEPLRAGAALAPNEQATSIGERRTIRLADGSRVTLNTQTRLAMAFTAERRLVRLTQGQALFEVAPDKRRPFIVQAAGRQITALGTVFEVRVDPGRMHVLLIEGRVVVNQANDAGASTTAAAPALLRPGQELIAEFGEAQRIVPVDVPRQLLWRDGFVEFDNEPLGRAVAEMNRYAVRSILLKDDNVAALRISGVFRTGNPDRFVSTVGEILPIEARAMPHGQIELSRAKHGGH